MKHVVKISVMAAFLILLLGAAFTPTASAWYPPQPAYCTYVPTYSWGYGPYPTVNYVYVCYPNQTAVPYNYAYVPYNYYGYAPYNNYAYAPYSYNYSYVPYNNYAYVPHNNAPYFDRRFRDYGAGRSYPNNFSNHWNYSAGWKK